MEEDGGRAQLLQQVPVFFTGYALLCVAVSLLVFRHVEEPARRWLRSRLTARVRPESPATLVGSART